MSDELNLENLDAALENVDAAADEAPVADAPAEAVESAEPVAEAPVASPETVAESAEEESEVNESEQAEETDAGQKAVDEFSKSLRTLDGKWYVLHTYSGYEKRVKTNIESRVASFGMEDQIFQVEVPMEEVEKHTEKGKKVITRVRVPGYVLIRMWPDENARRVVRETEGVTGFVGPSKDPAPLSRQEVVAMMAPMIASEALKAAGDKPAAAKKRKVEVSYAVGDQVTVTDGLSPLWPLRFRRGTHHPEAHRARVHLRSRYTCGARLPPGAEARLIGLIARFNSKSPAITVGLFVVVSHRASRRIVTVVANRNCSRNR